MDERIRGFVRDVLTYGIGGAANGLIRVALIPIISRYLQPETLGVYTLLMMIISFLYIVFDMGLSYALMKWYGESGEPDSRTKAGGTALVSMVIGGGALCGIGLVFSEFFSASLLGTVEHTGLVRLAILVAWLSSLFQLQLSILRGSGRPRGFVLFTAIRGLSNLAFTMALVMLVSMGVSGFMWGMLLSFGLGIVAFGLVMKPRPAVSPRLFLRMLSYGLPLMPSNLAIWFLTYADVYLLKSLRGLRDVGLYQFAQELCIPISLLLVSFERGWPHFIFSHAREEKSEALFHRILELYVGASILVGFILAVFRFELLSFLSATPYLDSATVLPLLVCSGVLFGAFYIFGTGLLLSGKTFVLPCITLGAAIGNVLLNLLLIPKYGIVGAGWATALTNLVMASCTLLISSRYHPLKFKLAVPGIIGGTAILAYAGLEIAHRAHPVPLLARIVLTVLLGLVICRIVFRTGTNTDRRVDSWQ